MSRCNVPIKETDLTRMALIGGMKDRSLAEKALADNYDLKTTIDTMKTRESSKAKAYQQARRRLKDSGVTRLGRIPWRRRSTD